MKRAEPRDELARMRQEVRHLASQEARAKQQAIAVNVRFCQRLQEALRAGHESAAGVLGARRR